MVALMIVDLIDHFVVQRLMDCVDVGVLADICQALVSSMDLVDRVDVR